MPDPAAAHETPRPRKLSSRNVLNAHSKRLFADDTLFHRIARTICDAGCLPRKELFEAWEVAKRVRRRMRGGHIYDLAAGHGVVAAILLILDDTSPAATCIDLRQPASHSKVLNALTRTWPRLDGRIRYVVGDISTARPTTDDIVVSVHACGPLTDDVLAVARRARCRVAVLPCCHDLKRCPTGAYSSWMEPTLAIDVARVVQMQAADFDVTTQLIPEAITPKNRLLLAIPSR